jgi:hypothetical protein
VLLHLAQRSGILIQGLHLMTFRKDWFSDYSAECNDTVFNVACANGQRVSSTGTGSQ